jgi:hypothetical protein
MQTINPLEWQTMQANSNPLHTGVSRWSHPNGNFHPTWHEIWFEKLNSIMLRGSCSQCSPSMLNSPRRKSQQISFHTITQLFRTRKKFALCVEIKITAYALGFPAGGEAQFDYLLGWINQLCCCVGVWLSNQKGPHASRPNICHSCRLFGFTMNHPPLIRPERANAVSVLFIYAH